MTAQQECSEVPAAAPGAVGTVVAVVAVAGARWRLDTLVFSAVGTDRLDADLACVAVNAGTGSFARLTRTPAPDCSSLTGFFTRP